MYLHKSTPPSTSSSRLGQTPDQDSMISTLKSYCVYKEILELRAHITELDSRQSGVTVGDSGTWSSSVNLQAFVDDEPNAIPLLLTPPVLLPEPLVFYGQPSHLEYGPLEYLGVNSTLPEGVDPLVGQLPQDLFLCDTSSSASNEPDAQSFLPQDGTYSVEQTLPYPSELPLPIVQGSQDKIKCTQPGCWRVIRKDGLGRHVNETHRRKIKAVCASCGKGFMRPYMERDHICQAGRRSS
ncbi:hypothetical protein DFH29DRAFT_1069848 [Suillus ampliporus]|nr:hypothetical protein DFH29DRAFT_1069848 [Suillus ampliporus]